MPPLTLRAGVTLLAFVGVFMAVSAVAGRYEDALGGFVRTGGAVGFVAFVLLTAIFTVFIIPFDSSVLIPLATTAWGPLSTAFMCVLGWTLGSAIAFFLARRYGPLFVATLVGARRLEEGRERTPHENVFWWALFTQALVPIDVVSYAFGLFTGIGIGWYVLATALGDLVPAFFFAYTGSLPVWYQAGAFAAGLIVIALLFRHFARAHRAP